MYVCMVCCMFWVEPLSNKEPSVVVRRRSVSPRELVERWFDKISRKRGGARRASSKRAIKQVESRFKVRLRGSWLGGSLAQR